LFGIGSQLQEFIQEEKISASLPELQKELIAYTFDSSAQLKMLNTFHDS